MLAERFSALSQTQIITLGLSVRRGQINASALPELLYEFSSSCVGCWGPLPSRSDKHPISGHSHLLLSTIHCKGSVYRELHVLQSVVTQETNDLGITDEFCVRRCNIKTHFMYLSTHAHTTRTQSLSVYLHKSFLCTKYTGVCLSMSYPNIFTIGTNRPKYK